MEDLLASISLRLPWGLQPGPAGVPHIGWFAVDPELGRKGSWFTAVNLAWRKRSSVDT